MSSKERKEHEKLELRKKILEAAKEILFEKGFENLTMRAIGEKNRLFTNNYIPLF